MAAIRVRTYGSSSTIRIRSDATSPPGQTARVPTTVTVGYRAFPDLSYPGPVLLVGTFPGPKQLRSLFWINPHSPVRHCSVDKNSSVKFRRGILLHIHSIFTAES